MKIVPDAIVILVFEGPDKGGKGASIKEVNKQSDYAFLCIDRFTGSAWVYDRLSRRRNREARIAALEAELASLKSAIVVNILVTGSPELLRRRIIAEDESAKKRLAELDIALRLYKKYSRIVTRLPTIIVDTSAKMPVQSAAHIIRKVSQYVKTHCQRHQQSKIED